MSMRPQHRPGPRVWPAAFSLAVAVCLAGVLGVFAYARHGAPLLERLDTAVGEVLMNEGIRIEEAGVLDDARVRYERALAARFAGSQNRIYTHKRLGAVLWKQGRFEAALPHLRNAVQGPHAQLSAFEILCDALFHLERYDAAAAVIPDWLAAADAADAPKARATALLFQGRVALRHGDLDAAQPPLEASYRLDPGGRAASELAFVYYKAGRHEKALELIDAYLAGGARGDRADYVRELRTRILEEAGR